MKVYRDDMEEDFLRSLPRVDVTTFHREWLAAVLLILAFLGLLFGLIRLGVFKFSYYQAQAASNRIARITLAPPRGEILDRKGNLLAINHAVYDCYFITSGDVEQDIHDLQELAEFLGLAAGQVEAVVESCREANSERSMQSELWAAGWGALGARSIQVKRDMNQVEVTALLERNEQFPRAFLERAYRRSYPAGETMAQVVGYTLEISEQELSEWAPLGYRMGDMYGKAGLERQYDNMLRGRPGERLVAVDVQGRILGEAESVPAVVPEGGAVVVRGDEVAVLEEGDVVDFDGGVRVSVSGTIAKATRIRFEGEAPRPKAVEDKLWEDEGTGGTYDDWHVFRRAGEVVHIEGVPVMRPAVVYPTAGAGLLTTLDLDMQRALDDVLGDAVGGVLAMDPRDGSILAMVSEPAFDPNLFSGGGVDPSGWEAIMEDPNFPLLNRPVHNAYVPGSTFKLVTFLAAGDADLLWPGRVWQCRGRLELGNRYFNCWNRGGHGRVNATRAVAESCDVAFWLMADELGHDPIADMARAIGFGAPTGVDLPAETGGLIPDDAWKRERWGDPWYTGDTYNMAIGQGFVQANLLQIARMTSVVANEGYLVPPHLNRLLTPDTTTLEGLQRLEAPASAIQMLRQGMRQCVTNGTGRACNLDWIEIAGKSGTADDPPREDPHSWFISFGPYDNPTLVLVVLLENADDEAEKAPPLSARIWETDAVKAYLEEAGEDQGL